MHSSTMHRFLLMDRLGSRCACFWRDDCKTSGSLQQQTLQKSNWQGPLSLKMIRPLKRHFRTFPLTCWDLLNMGCKPILSCSKQFVISWAFFYPKVHQPWEGGDTTGSLWKAETYWAKPKEEGPSWKDDPPGWHIGVGVVSQDVDATKGRMQFP